MNDKIQILTLALDCDSAIALVQLCLIEKGLYAKHAFELTSACATFTDQYCPHQPDQSCNCQVITLQIYGRDLSPVSLVFHSHDSSTEIFYILDSTSKCNRLMFKEYLKRSSKIKALSWT